MSSATHCLGALALEVSADQPAGRLALERDQAELLAADLALDLQRLLPGVTALDGAFACAHFDPAELLRPGWPVHAALADLAASAPGRRGGRLIAFGARDGTMPSPLIQPDPAFAGGLLRLLPFVLLGEADDVARVGRDMEERLLDTGMAAAGLALQAQSRFGLVLEHARFLSIHDLCAMTAMQYQHAGLDPLWRLIEAALLAPDTQEWLRAEDEPLALFHGGQIRVADADFESWRRARHDRLEIVADDDPRYLQHRRRVRQMMAVIGAHGIPVERVPVLAGEPAEQALRPVGH